MKTKQKAVHKHFPETIVTVKNRKDFLGKVEKHVTFKNGETTALTPKRFDELFTIIKGVQHEKNN